MEKKPGMSAPVEELVSLPEVSRLPRVKRLFPTEGSVQWALRIHRAEYLAGQAVYEIAGILLIHPERFERVSLEIGARTLQERLEKKEASGENHRR